VQLWTSSEGGCLNACLASLVDVHPVDVPHDDDSWFDVERLNRWLEPRGRRLVPVWPAETWGESYPTGAWVAFLGRGPGLAHAVLAEGNRITHDPGHSNGGSAHLYPGELAHARDRSQPLGYRLVTAA
jgi:hypothetical protein